MRFFNFFREDAEELDQTRKDAFRNENTGEGTDDDPLSSGIPIRDVVDGNALYKASGLVQQICDIPASDAVREWFDLEIKLDEMEASSEDEKILSRAVMLRLEELKAKDRIRELIKYSRRFSGGGILFAGILDDIPSKADDPKNSLASSPSQIKKIEFLNVLYSGDFQRTKQGTDGTAINFHSHRFTIGGHEVHPQRVRWLCRRYLPDEDDGISMPESILLAVRSHNSASRTVAKMADELYTKILKSNTVLPPEKEAAFLKKIKRTLSVLSVLRIRTDETLERPTLSLGGISELFQFIWENVAALTGIPQSRFKGNQQGAVAGAENDLITHYDSVRSEIQEGELREIIDWLIELILQEDAISELIPSDTVDWNIKWKPLWQMTPVQKAEVELKQAQRDKIYSEIFVLSPIDIRTERFKELEPFSLQEDKKPNVPTSSGKTN